MLVKFVTLLLILFVYQVKALPTKIEEGYALKNLEEMVNEISYEDISEEILQALFSSYHESLPSLDEFLSDNEVMLSRFNRCTLSTKLKMLEVVAEMVGSYNFCISMTDDMKNMSILGFDWYNLTKTIIEAVKVIPHSIYSCHNGSGPANFTICILNEAIHAMPKIAETLDDFENLLKKAIIILSKVWCDMKHCFSFHKTELEHEVLRILKNNC